MFELLNGINGLKVKGPFGLLLGMTIGSGFGMR